MQLAPWVGIVVRQQNSESLAALKHSPMDLISGLRSELFRPLVTIVVPGSIAVAPYVLVVLSAVDEAARYSGDHPTAFTAIFLVLVIAAGFLLEDIGSRIEESCWDHRLKTKDADFEPNWHKYLQLTTKDEIVGQRYLRTLLTRMKFELATAPALIVHAAGLVWLNQHHPYLTGWELVLVTIGLLVVAIYLLWESYDGAETLGRIRKDVIAGAGGSPSATP